MYLSHLLAHQSRCIDSLARYVAKQSHIDELNMKLALKLQLDSLAKLAFDDIQSKISSHNILHELFSAFTAR